jgi:hypothetical protein
LRDRRSEDHDIKARNKSIFSLLNFEYLRTVGKPAAVAQPLKTVKLSKLAEHSESFRAEHFRLGALESGLTDDAMKVNLIHFLPAACEWAHKLGAADVGHRLNCDE